MGLLSPMVTPKSNCLRQTLMVLNAKVRWSRAVAKVHRCDSPKPDGYKIKIENEDGKYSINSPPDLIA